MPPETPKLPPKAPTVTRPDGGQGAVVAERKTAKTKPPRMFQVVMLNDDYTPMEFVVMVLQQTFKRDLGDGHADHAQNPSRGPRRLRGLLQGRGGHQG